MNKNKIFAYIGGGVILILGSYLIYRAIKRKKNTIYLEGSFKGANCDELHAFQNTGSKVIGGMHDKVRAKLEELYNNGVNPEVKKVWVDMNADTMQVNWKVKIAPSKDGKAWVGFTSRGSSGNNTAYDRAEGIGASQQSPSNVLKKLKETYNDPNIEMEVVEDFLYNLNREKEILGKCPTRQIFYKYTRPKQYAKQ